MPLPAAALLTVLMAPALSGCAGAPAASAGNEFFAPGLAGSGRAGYLGPQGTYSQEACYALFRKEERCAPYPGVREAVEALLRGEVSYAVIPAENTLGGPTSYVPFLMNTPDIAIAGAAELPITQHLLTLPGTSLAAVKRVYSHKQGLIQSETWLKQHLPEAELTEVASTAAGAERLLKNHEKDSAAIASAGAAAVYGLRIAAAGIQGNDRNKTRFYALTRKTAAAPQETGAAEGAPEIPAKAPGDSKADMRHYFTAEGNIRDLPALMSAMRKSGLTLIAFYQEPLKTDLGSYRFFMECSGSFRSYQRLAEQSPVSLSYLGSFDPTALQRSSPDITPL
ncbi:prephenate dehydratase [Succinimonas sp.]|uniref:prephenate dehydratase n=1 Tax=Succinimonas sp. TaxID=1936151 RepID=UPI00386C089D